MTLDRRLRILIADDDVPTAFELEACLREAGFEPIGPAFDVQDTVDLIACNHLDAVILDVALVAKAAQEVMQPLVANRTPIVFLTGYKKAELPDWAPPAAFCMKPCASFDLVEALHDAMQANCGRGAGAHPAGLPPIGSSSELRSSPI